MSLEYFESKYVFDQFCEIFGIDALKQDDFELTPEIIDEPTTEEMRKKLRLPLLIVAAVSDPSNWKELYDDYCEKLDVLQFHRCKTITLNYEGELKDESIQYHKDGTELFYVKDWMGRRVFKDFTADLMEYLDIDMDTNILEGIFEADEENQSDIIDHYVSYELSSDKDFINTLEYLNKDIAMGIQIVDRSDEEDMADTSPEFGNKIRKELNDLDDERQTYDEDNPELQDEEEDDLQDEDEHDDDVEDGDEDDILPVDDEDDDLSEPEDEDKEAEDEEPLDDGDDLDDEPEESEPQEPYKQRAVDDKDRDAYNHPTDNGRTAPSSHGHTSEDRPRTDFQPRHIEQSPERHYNDDRQRPERQYTGKRRNYMGYNPDETSHRQFNVGKQEATTLETREATKDEISRLSSLLGRAFDCDSIVDENYLVRMRFYNSVKNKIGEPNMSEKEFITKGRKYLQTKTGKYVHRCSARGGILYVSPSIWNRVKYENCIICMYYGKKANEFLYIRSQKELMDMIDKDAILVQVTGNDKGRFVNKVYDSHFPGMDGNIYTMIRTIKTHGDDFIFEPTDTSNKNDNEFDPDLV